MKPIVVESDEEGYSLVKSKNKRKTKNSAADKPSFSEVTAGRRAPEVVSSEKSTVVTGKKVISFADKHRNRSSDTVVILGDSLTRGVGHHLQNDSHMFSRTTFSGIGIQELTNEIKRRKDNPVSHLVIMVGTNDIKKGGSEETISKYRELIEIVKTKKHRQVSMVGILRRRDLVGLNDSRRIGINLRLAELCKENNFGYIYKELQDRQLGRDGLHLNWKGQDAVAREIFKHCIPYLN